MATHNRSCLSTSKTAADWTIMLSMQICGFRYLFPIGGSIFKSQGWFKFKKINFDYTISLWILGHISTFKTLYVSILSDFLRWATETAKESPSKKKFLNDKSSIHLNFFGYTENTWSSDEFNISPQFFASKIF